MYGSDLLIKVHSRKTSGKAQNKWMVVPIYAVVTNKSMSKKARMAVHISVLLPTLMYGSECRVWQVKHESRINNGVARI